MPRRLTVPDLADDAIRLVPLTRRLAPELQWVVDGDPDTRRFTLIPSDADEAFLSSWLGRYEHGWEDGSCAGFAAREAGEGRIVAFAAFVHLELDRAQGEIGYLVDRAARGRGTAARSVALLTCWGFDELGLERIELRIDPANDASSRVAERCGYRREGVLRSTYFKEGLRSDVAVWSRLSHD